MSLEKLTRRTVVEPSKLAGVGAQSTCGFENSGRSRILVFVRSIVWTLSSRQNDGGQAASSERCPYSKTARDPDGVGERLPF